MASHGFIGVGARGAQVTYYESQKEEVDAALEGHQSGWQASAEEIESRVHNREAFNMLMVRALVAGQGEPACLQMPPAPACMSALGGQPLYACSQSEAASVACAAVLKRQLPVIVMRGAGRRAVRARAEGARAGEEALVQGGDLREAQRAAVHSRGGADKKERSRRGQ